MEEIDSTNDLENTQASTSTLVGLDMTKLDKKSMEILDETDESDYRFKLDDFEGPLDLLVHLRLILETFSFQR